MPSIQLATITSVLFLALAGAQTIDPSSVPIGTRTIWCTNQQASCPLLCYQIGGSGTPTSNTCDATTLDYACVCSNGMSPNASEFSQTIPYYECTTYNDQCVSDCGTDSTCVTNCRTSHPCGAQHPVSINATTSTTSMSSSQTASSATGTGSRTSAESAAASTGAAVTGTASSSSSAPSATSSSTSGGVLARGVPVQVCGAAIGLVTFFVGYAVLL